MDDGLSPPACVVRKNLIPLSPRTRRRYNFFKIKVNPFGFYTFLVSALTALPYYLGLTITKALTDNGALDDPKLNTYDTVGKIWSKSWLAMTLSYPEIVNKAKADAVDGGCLIVANHASWLDIPVICTALDGPFKFIAKGEVRLRRRLRGARGAERSDEAPRIFAPSQCDLHSSHAPPFPHPPTPL